MPFLFQAKYGLLTYAQCGGLDPSGVCEHLGRIGAECIIGREDHEDGGVHLHAFFMFEREYRTRDERHFDVGGCHPNVVRGYGTPEKGYDYAIKDGDVVAGGLARPCRDGVSKDGNVWAELVLAGDREEFFDMCTRLVPRALLCNFTSLRCYADWKYRTDPDEYEHPRSVQLSTSRYPELDSWVQSNLGGHGDSGEYSCTSFRRCLLLPPVAWPESQRRPLLHSSAPDIQLYFSFLALILVVRTTPITDHLRAYTDRQDIMGTLIS